MSRSRAGRAVWSVDGCGCLVAARSERCGGVAVLWCDRVITGTVLARAAIGTPSMLKHLPLLTAAPHISAPCIVDRPNSPALYARV